MQPFAKLLRRPRTVVMSLVIATGAGASLWARTHASADAPVPPDQHQSASRVRDIAMMEVQRTGRVRISALPSDSRANGSLTTHRLVLQSPASEVEDTDIRGVIDGFGKYDMNHGTAYHLRVGRRSGGPKDGEYELRRTLVRWKLPPLPADTRITRARAVFRIEANALLTRFDDGQARSPLHVFAYPTGENWVEGHGGVNHDDFSAPASGEANWMEARVGEAGWNAPGGLAIAADPGRPYQSQPIGIGTIELSDSTLIVEAPALARYIQARLPKGSVDFLLKLEDDEEDFRGTEVSLFSSEFGTVLDQPSKRPLLELDLLVPGSPADVEHEFVLEPGAEEVLPRVQRRANSPAVFDVEIEGTANSIPPLMLVRGGSAREGPSRWVPLVDGLVRDWDWWEAKIVAGGPTVALADTFSIDLLATFVTPGPRELQVPELVLVAPSGMQYVVNGVALPERRYRMSYVPREPGLWRFGWSFRPTAEHPPGSQQGQGTFFVRFSGDSTDATILRSMAIEVARMLPVESDTTLAFQSRINRFLRGANRYREAHPEAEQWTDSLIEAARGRSSDALMGNASFGASDDSLTKQTSPPR